MTTGGSYLSASDPRPLFGLGTAGEVEFVDIEWPSGVSQRIRAPAANRYQSYEEPEFDGSGP